MLRRFVRDRRGPSRAELPILVGGRERFAIPPRLRPTVAGFEPNRREPAARGSIPRPAVAHRRIQQRDGSYPFADRLKFRREECRSTAAPKPVRSPCADKVLQAPPAVHRPDGSPSCSLRRCLSHQVGIGIDGRCQAQQSLRGCRGQGEHTQAAEPSPMIESRRQFAPHFRRASPSWSAMISSSEFFARSMPQ